MLLLVFATLYMGIIVPLAVLMPLGMAVYKYPMLRGEYKILTWYLVLAGITNGIAKAMAMYHINNLPLLHVYTALEFLILSMFYRSILKEYRVVKWILPTMAFFLIFCIVNAIFFQRLYIYNSYSRSLSAFIIIIYAVIYFKQALDRVYSPAQQPLLWINSALLIYFGGSFFLFISANLILTNAFMNTMIWNIHATLVLIMYILFTIGLSYAKRN